MKNAKKNRKKNPQNAFLIPVSILAIITLLVVIGTSYFLGDGNTTPDDEQPEQPIAPTPGIIMPPPDSTDDTDIDEPEPHLEEAVIDIYESHPELIYSLDHFALKSGAVAVSLAAFDANLQKYYVYQYGFKDTSTHALIDVDTVFNVASLSKLVTVICAMTLVDDGLLDIDKDISEYLGFEVRHPGFPESRITARMLMQHTASLAYIDAYYYFSLEDLDRPETIQKLLEDEATWGNWEPGTRYEYSAWLAHSLIAITCESLSGQRFDEFARNVLFDPIGIDAAFLGSNLKNTDNIAVQYDIYTREIVYTVEDTLLANYETRVSDHDRAGAHLLISALDYARILAMLGNGGVYNETRIISERSVNEITDANVFGTYYLQGLSTRYESDRLKTFYGYFWHAGGAWGTSAHYIHRFDEGVNHGVVVITTGVTEHFPRETTMDLSVIALQILTK